MPDELYRTTMIRFNPIFVHTVSPATPFNQTMKTTGPSDQRWQVDMLMQISNPATYALMRRFIVKQRGGKVLTRIYDLQMTTAFQTSQPVGAGAATSSVNLNADAAAGAETVTLRGLTASQSVSLSAMDQLGIGENLYAVEDSAASDSGGLATVNIWPPLRMGAADGDPVNLVKPTGLFKLVSGGDQLGSGLDKLGDAFSLSFIEEPMFS